MYRKPSFLLHTSQTSWSTNQWLCPGISSSSTLTTFVKIWMHQSQMHTILCRLLVSLTKKSQTYSPNILFHGIQATPVVMLIPVFSWVLLLFICFWHYKQCWNKLSTCSLTYSCFHLCVLVFSKWIYWADTCVFFI